MMDSRLPEHRKNSDLEAVLSELNAALSECSPKPDKYLNTAFPTLFIVGCPRCGSTLFLQWLASSGLFGYVSNLAARVWTAPKIAALLQRALVELDERGEIMPVRPEGSNFLSQLGKTQGAAEPHEYWNFWRRYFFFDEAPRINPAEIEAVDADQLRHEIAQMESVFSKPMVFKAMVLNWHIPWLAEVFDKAIFIHLKRDPTANACSLLNARIQFYGDRNAWYSSKPPEYENIKDQPPEMQVARQVIYTNRAVENGLNAIDPERKLEINYESFCADPAKAWSEIVSKLKCLGYALPKEYKGSAAFGMRMAECPEAAEIAEIIKSLELNGA